MKIVGKTALVLAVAGLATSVFTSGCADKEPPAPPHVAVVGFVPDYCFWDGYEYVGWYGDDYYYWGPNRVWVVCDPVRVQRVNVFIRAHPNWNVRARPNVQYPVDAHGHPQPLRAPPARHDHGRDHDHDHD